MADINNIKISSILHDDEQVLWQGRPVKGIKPTTYGCFTIPILIILFGVIYNQKLDLLFPLLIIIFFIQIVLTAYQIMGSKFRSRKYYALTDRRVIIITNNVLFHKSYELSKFEFMLCSKRKKGFGTIMINKSRITNTVFCIIIRYIVNPLQPCLRLIPNVDEVYQKIIDSKAEIASAKL